MPYAAAQPYRPTGAAGGPRYCTRRTASGDFQVFDRCNAYGLHSYAVAEAARAVTEQMNRDPVFAVGAVHRHDAELRRDHDPAVAEALVDIRRFGYHGLLGQEGAHVLHEVSAWQEWAREGHLIAVRSEAGKRYYQDPRAAVPLDWPKTGLPVVQDVRAERTGHLFSPALVARCDAHGCPVGECPLCGPRQPWQCAWCPANAVTVVRHRPTCDRCLRIALGPNT
ncbi:hypothetical protein [Streptomyces smyrnaeus]|uniref:hypothetical protein n=1 Tax=Streptomyces smyrnaeus TaxID=1387713 RepID=UPI000C192B1B